MGVRMNVAWDDGTRVLAAGEECFDFPSGMEARLVRSGLAEALPTESLDHARASVGMEALGDDFLAPSDDIAPSISMTKAELIALAEQRGIAVETDDNKADLVRKINADSFEESQAS